MQLVVTLKFKKNYIYILVICSSQLVCIVLIVLCAKGHTVRTFTSEQSQSSFKNSSGTSESRHACIRLNVIINPQVESAKQNSRPDAHSRIDFVTNGTQENSVPATRIDDNDYECIVSSMIAKVLKCLQLDPSEVKTV